MRILILIVLLYLSYLLLVVGWWLFNEQQPTVNEQQSTINNQRFFRSKISFSTKVTMASKAKITAALKAASV